MQRELMFMQKAIELAQQGMNKNEGGPFGCIIVKHNEIIGEGNNKVLSLNDPTAHAEIVAIRKACQYLKTFQLTDCEVFTSCEPCPMCLGALYWARPSKIYFANTREDAALIGFDDAMIYKELTQPYASRKIPMLHVHSEQALQLFKQWQLKANKQMY